MSEGLMNTYVFLRDGYYWAAGKQFGWPSSDPGVGIAVEKIEKALPDGVVNVESRYDHMYIFAREAKYLADQYNWYMKVKNKKLAIIPKSKFRRR